MEGRALTACVVLAAVVVDVVAGVVLICAVGSCAGLLLNHACTAGGINATETGARALGRKRDGCENTGAEEEERAVAGGSDVVMAGDRAMEAGERTDEDVVDE